MTASASLPARRAANGSEAAPALAQQYLTFTVAGDLYGFDIRQIKEIIEYGQVSAVPMMPEFVRGVINLRGNVVPVIDLSCRFRKGLSSLNKRSCIVILEMEQADCRTDVGVVVDSVCEVLDIAAHDIEPPPTFGSRIRTEFIQGMGKVNGTFVVLLAMNQVLNLDEVTALEQLTQAEETGPDSAQT